METVNLLFGTHNSQPAGSDDYQFEKAYQEAYKPFLTVLYNFPQIRVVLHYSGILLEWLEKNHPEFLMLLNEMVKRKQVELLGGGFYDPILPMIPGPDRIGQIELLTTFIRKRFGKRPRGCWITQQIYEPSLVYMLNSSGMDYIFLEDSQFREAGAEEEELAVPCITEDQGKIINVYPVSSAFHSLVPYEDPEQVIKTIAKFGEKRETVVLSIIKRGEDYGLLNKTGKLCYQDGWFERFFSLLIENQDIELVNPGTFLKNYIPENKRYFPCTVFTDGAQIPESKEESGRRDKSGCFKKPLFRQILTKYEESNLLYAKMIYTNILVNQIRGDKYRKKTAREELWRGQCNNAYGYHFPGGIYSSKLRKAAYNALIEAEKITHEKGIFIPSIIAVDFDMDGRKEYLYQGNDLNAYIHEKGGILFELDYLPKCWNYLDSMSRYIEPAAENASSEKMVEDKYLRKSFIDHFFLKNESIEKFDSMEYREAGGFIHTFYSVKDFDRDHKRIKLQAENMVGFEDAGRNIEIVKSYSFNGDTIHVDYHVTNKDEKEFTSIFGVEINLALASKGLESQRIYNTSKQKSMEVGVDPNEVKDVRELTINDIPNEVEIKFNIDKAADIWVLPVETVTPGENGLETNYQSTSFVPRWQIKLKPGDSWENTLALSFSHNE